MTWKESLEDWELDCPHRFKYKDLYAATKGFKESEVIGVGGFGAVYKDAELNARLGDFGLARLYDHDKLSYTTNVVGTIGYLAPELARTEARPTMRQVTRYLSGDDPLPAFPDLGSVDFRSASEMNSKSLELISGDMTRRSYPPSSFGGITSSSIDVGR
ncbi:lectin-domain containing receptor kinase VI.3-like [Fagus crenata]